MTFPLAVLSGLAFISLGLPDGLLGVAWLSIRTFFGVELDAVGALLAATTTGYVTSSFSSGRLLGHVNVGGVLALSSALTAVALLGYAATSAWPFVIAFGVVLGLGSGAVDSSLNTYAATQHGPRTLNWLHACYGVGAASGPLIMTAVLSMALPWQRGYTIVGLSQLLLAGGFAATFSWWQRGNPTAIAREDARERSATIAATLRLAGARLGIAAFVVYAGVEGSMGIWTYTLLTEARGVPPAEAGGVVSLFWGSLTGGRLLAAAGAGRVPPGPMLALSLSGVVCGTALVWLKAAPMATYAGIVLAGCACGPIFPTLVATTPVRVGPRHAANAVGFQIAAAALGLALLPGAIGVAADAFGIELIATLFLVLASLLMIVYKLLEHVAPA